MSATTAAPDDQPSNVIQWRQDIVDAAFGPRDDPDATLLEQVLDGLIATVDDEAAS